MAEDYGFTFTPEEMTINDNLGYPKAYEKLCRDRGFGPYSHGPPFSFMPYALQEDEAERARNLDQMFPIIDPKAKPTTKPKIFVNVLWKQLSHLGNAGFNPAVIRVDAYGNVLYYHADSASPLNWGIDHWFPCSRGGLTVLSNLRILQRQACKRKKNKLEFLIPWWDFQLGISVNQFLSIFASSNSDFRHRAFSFLFSEGENHELNASQIVDSHSFPQHFFGLKEEVGLAPAAIIESQKESYDALALRQLDYNRKPRPMSPLIVASRKSKGNLLKENKDPEFDNNPYQAIVMARDSLKQREENTRVQAEIQKLDNEMNEMKHTNDKEKFIIQDLELALIRSRRKAEKYRRVAEAQCSYRTMIEKMIRDTMHQSVMYKEQVRLNQVAITALMARHEAQKEICDAAEKELHKKSLVALEKENSIEHKLEKLEISEGKRDCGISFPVLQETETEEDEECRKQRGKGNVEKWLQILLENSQEDRALQETKKNETSATEEIIKQLNQKYPQQELEISKVPDFEYKEGEDRIENEARSVMRTGHKNYTEEVACIDEGNGTTSFEEMKRKEQHKKERMLVRSESARALRRIPSPPSLLLGIRKGVERIRKKSIVSGIDDGNGDLPAANNLFRSPIKTIKKAMKF
ncbi:hypothetical protein SESBI_08454 [Sesbania bispinosa]|nr:hypothetical protein SESBI_08454 [Sesbania bispinosa]